MTCLTFILFFLTSMKELCYNWQHFWFTSFCKTGNRAFPNLIIYIKPYCSILLSTKIYDNSGIIYYRFKDDYFLSKNAPNSSCDNIFRGWFHCNSSNYIISGTIYLIMGFSILNDIHRKVYVICPCIITNIAEHKSSLLYIYYSLLD